MCTFPILALASTLLTAMSQEPATLPGTNLPVTMKPSQLAEGWIPLKLKEQSSGALGDYYSSYYFQFATLGVGPSGIEGNARIRDLFEILPVSWTKNEMVEVYGQKFLVTYILEPSIERLQAFAKGAPLQGAELKLKLMKADQIGTIEPYPELTRDRYVQILEGLSDKGEPAMRAADRTIALSNAKQLALGMLMYSADYDDVLPYVQSTSQLQEIVNPYLKNNELWKTRNPKGGMVRFNMSLAGVLMTDIDEPASTPMLYDSVAWPDGMYLVAFADGHVKFMSEAEWTATKKYLSLKLKRHGKPIKPSP